MKKRILSTLLALTLCLSLLPAALAADDVAETLTAAEAESKYGLSLSTDYVDFGSYYQWDDLKVVTLTLTNNGSHRFDYEYRMGNPLAHTAPNGPVTIRFGKGNILEPGESVDIQVRLNPNQVGSGPLSANFKFLIDPQNASHIGPDGIAIGKSGLTLDVTDVLTIDYEVKSENEISAKDIAYDVSVNSIDFGTIENPYPSLSKTFTVTNRGSLTFYYFYQIDPAHKDQDLFSISDNGDGYRILKPGQSMDVTVTTKENYDHHGPRLVIEDCPLIFEGYYSTDLHSAPKEENTVTTVIPLSVTLLKDGGICSVYGTDDTGGVAVTEDGHRFTGSGTMITVAPGSDLTIRLTPWREGYAPLALEVDRKFATSEDTYTFENIGDDINFRVYFYNPKVPPAPWAKEAAGKARVLGISSDSIEDFSLPITRREFCEYAFDTYHAITGDVVMQYVIDNPYTDTASLDVVRLSKLGVITGTGDGRFDPEGQLTREQAATILSRLAQAMGVELPSAAPTFTDNASIGSWAAEAVGQMQQNGIMGGVGDNKFGPQGTYSFEQSLVTLMRLYDLCSLKYNKE